MRAGIQMGNFFCASYQNFLINDLNRAHALIYVFARNPIHVAMFSIFPGEPEARFTFFSRERERERERERLTDDSVLRLYIGGI